MFRHCIAVLTASLLLLCAPGHAGVISVGPYTVSTTSPFVVPILVGGAVDLDTFTFDLAFNPADYQINTACDPFSDTFCDFVTGPVTQGTFYTSVASFPPLFNPGFILLDLAGNQTGVLLGVNGAWQDPGPGPSANGVLAFVEFIAVAGGATSPITIVGPPARVVPEPATVPLIVVALLGLALQRRPLPIPSGRVRHA